MKLTHLTALLDANVLYPAPLRDFMVRLAIQNLFRAKWSEQIHQEWIEGVLRNRPDLTRIQLERTKALMDNHVQDAVVEDYESLIEDLSLPDPDDRHVVAAAIQGKADVIVTFNIKDFPRQTLSTYNLDVQHPDTFVLQLFERQPLEVISVASEQRQSLRRPPKSADAYLSTLEQVGLKLTASILQKNKHLI